jgi:hypothetical protein
MKYSPAYWLLLASFSCSTVGPSGSVKIRIRNESSFTMSNIVVGWPGEEMRVNALAPGAISDYERHDSAYGYGAVSATLNGAIRQIIPIDYVGERPLDAGKYTYNLSAPASPSTQLELRLQVDQ